MRKIKAFTLVELLVVIGIIALLISILLPSLSRARSAANAVVCLSNLRTVGSSLVMYVNEHKGNLPTPPWATSGTNPVTYTTSAGAQFTIAWGTIGTIWPAAQAYAAYGVFADLEPYGLTGKVNKCPADFSPRGGNWEAQKWSFDAAQGGAFANGADIIAKIEADQSFASGYYMPWPLRTIGNIKITKFKNPSSKIFMCESSLYAGGSNVNFPFQQAVHWEPFTAVRGTKTGRGQAVFMDGHAESYDLSQVMRIHKNPFGDGKDYYNLDQLSDGTNYLPYTEPDLR